MQALKQACCLSCMSVKAELLHPHLHYAHAATSIDVHPAPDKARATTNRLSGRI